MHSVARAVSKATRWFKGQCCLFLCDDLRGTKSRRYGYFYTLKSLVEEASVSRMLCSTRDKRIAQLAGIAYNVSSPTRPTEDVKEIICWYSGFKCDDIGN